MIIWWTGYRSSTTRSSTTRISPTDTVRVNRITCYGNRERISQCGVDFFTPLMSCQRVANLWCEGKYGKTKSTKKITAFFLVSQKCVSMERSDLLFLALPGMVEWMSVWMELGGLFVAISGTTVMPVWYVDRLDSLLMVSFLLQNLTTILLNNTKDPMQFFFKLHSYQKKCTPVTWA